MFRRRINAGSYEPLNTETDEHDQLDGFIDEQWVEPQKKFPWKTIIFILFFFVAGATCLTFSILVSSGVFNEKYDDRAWPLLILGILMFIPGGYYGYILLCIFLKRDGFTVEDIPMLSTIAREVDYFQSL